MMILRSHALSRPSLARVIALLRLCTERGKILYMFKKGWVNLLLVSLPLLLGVVAFILINVYSQSIAPFMLTADLGIFALVLGMTIRNLGTIALILGICLTGFLFIFYYRSLRREEQTQLLIEDAKYEAEQGRRRFLRRLDHEIKNPLTGLRAALVNMQEVQV